MPPIRYEKVQQEPVESEDYEGLLSHRSEQRLSNISGNIRQQLNYLLIGIVVVSVLCNAFFVSQVVMLSSSHDSKEESQVTEFVELRTDVPTPFDYADVSLWDPVWNSPQMSDSLGVVAVSEEFVKAKNLPSSMRFPWDDTKSVYVLSFHHSIHCLRWLRQSVLESHTGREQSLGFDHLGHCLNVLREDVMCHADDTPRYTGRMHSQANRTKPEAGIDQHRNCRDYNKLYEWSIENSACYDDMGDPNAPVLDYFKHCPDGKKLWD